jgi:hypothetical protein
VAQFTALASILAATPLTDAAGSAIGAKGHLPTEVMVFAGCIITVYPGGCASPAHARTGGKMRAHHANHLPPFKASALAPPAAGNGPGYTPTDLPQNTRRHLDGGHKETILSARAGTPSPRGSVRMPCDAASHTLRGQVGIGGVH